MITLEKVVEILKQFDIFREVRTKDGCHYSTEKVPENPVFSSLSYHSQATKADTLFFVKGRNFKEEYLKEAVEEGLSFYLSENSFDVAAHAILVSDVKIAMSMIAMHFYDYPQTKLKTIAYTGTKGKTTSAYFTHAILAEETDKKCALFSTLSTTLDGELYTKSALTTPESLDLFRMMDRCVKNGMTHLVMEVSSQAYKEKRVFGLAFDLAIFLNISPDHIGPIEHENFEDYFLCKRELLKNARKILLNRESDYFDLLLEEANSLCREVFIYGEGAENTNAYFVPKGTLDFSICQGERGGFEHLVGDFSLQLIGDFNKGNALAAAMSASLFGATPQSVAIALQKTRIPGRMEMLTQPNGSTVYVDYAHNKLSLSALIDVISTHHKGKIIVLIGSTGNKAESRRRDFAEILSEKADIAVLTADDPNFEDPEEICEEIKSMMTKDIETYIVADRKNAIGLAMSRATEPEDAVILAGKGADHTQVIENIHRIYEGDYDIAERIIRLHKGASRFAY